MAIHPANRQRIQRALRLLTPILNTLTPTEQQQVAMALQFIQTESLRDHYAPFNQTIVHQRNLERIVNRFDRGHGEEKYGF